jgi:hypothetical protein
MSAAAEVVVAAEAGKQQGGSAHTPRLADCSVVAVIAVIAVTILRSLGLRMMLFYSHDKGQAIEWVAVVVAEQVHSLERDLDLVQMALTSCESLVLHDWRVDHAKEVEVDMARHVLVLAPRTTQLGVGRNEASAEAVAVVLKAAMHSDCHICD